MSQFQEHFNEIILQIKHVWTKIWRKKCFALLVDRNALSSKMENSPTTRDLAMVLHQCEPAQMVGLAWRGFLEFILALTQSYLNCGYDHEL